MMDEKIRRKLRKGAKLAEVLFDLCEPGAFA
jgi:hypothetical protein